MYAIRKGQIKNIAKGDILGQKDFIHSLFEIAVLKISYLSSFSVCLKSCNRTKNSTCGQLRRSLRDRFKYVSSSKEQIFQETRLYYQDWYSNLKEDMSDNSDFAIALKLHQQHIPLPEIRKVLARSDRIHQLRQQYDDDRLYQQKAIDYIESIESSLSPVPSVQKQNTLEKSQTELEM